MHVVDWQMLLFMSYEVVPDLVREFRSCPMFVEMSHDCSTLAFLRAVGSSVLSTTRHVYGLSLVCT